MKTGDCASCSGVFQDTCRVVLQYFPKSVLVDLKSPVIYSHLEIIILSHSCQQQVVESVSILVKLVLNTPKIYAVPQPWQHPSLSNRRKKILRPITS